MDGPMEPVLLMALLLIAVGAGIVGAVFGLGGGIIFIPVLTVLFDFDATAAVAASLVGVVATSTGSASGFVRKGMSNIRLGMLLEITTCIGAMIGATVATYLENWILLALFSVVMLFSGVKMALSPERKSSETAVSSPMTFTYTDPTADPPVQTYTVKNVKSGMAMCTVAGMISSLTGVGGGVLKIPLMNLHMHVPVKVASATSSYMIGLTAFSGAIVYLLRDAVTLDAAAAVAVGAWIGALIGTRISARTNAKSLKKYMSVVFFAVAIVMACEAAGVF
jgi:uncharacterized membrane protein YfcA